MLSEQFCDVNVAFLPYKQIAPPMPSDRLYVGNVAFLPYNRIIAPMPSERSYVGNGEALPCKQIVAPKLSEGMYGGIGGKSIEYPRKIYRASEKSLESFPKKSREFFQKVYRVFSDRTIQTICYLQSPAPIVCDVRRTGLRLIRRLLGMGGAVDQC